MHLIDCHSHLYDNIFKNDRDQLIKNAQMKGVQNIVVVSEDFDSALNVLSLAKEYSGFILPCIGLHPCCITSKKQVDEMIDLTRKNSNQIFGIGEVGLDFSPHIVQGYNTTTSDELKQLQRYALSEFIQLSKELQLPLNIHSRSAGRPTIRLLEECHASAQYGVLLHAFDGNQKAVMRGLRNGFHFSIPPNIVRDSQLQQLAGKVPLDHLLLETDAPALAPFKQERNVPENIIYSCEKIATIKQLEPNQIAEITTKNAKDLFLKH